MPSTFATNERKMMNRKKLLPVISISLFVVGSAMVFSSCGDELKQSEPAYAEVVQVQGEAINLAVQETASLLKVGDTLGPGTSLETCAGSSLTLQFADQSKLLVSENSRLLLEDLKRSRKTGEVETVIRLDGGSAESRVTQQKEGFKPRYRVVTPAMQLAVRGTVFLVTVDKVTGRSSSTVLEGTVTASAGGEEVELLAGYGTVTEVGQPPGAPAALLDEPEIAPLPPSASRLPLQLAWAELPEAGEYRLQLLAGPGYEYLIHDGVYAGNHATLEDLPDADYLLRVRGIDGEGREGQNAERPFVLDAHPFPPEAKAPLDGDVSNRKKTRFKWAFSREAQSYLLQVSDREDFSTIVSQIADLPAAIGNISVKLSPGEYYWRVASVDRDEQGPFSSAQRFTVAEEK